MNYLRLCEGNFQFMMHSIISRRCNRQFMTRKCQFIYGEEERASIDFAMLPFFRRLLPSFNFAKIHLLLGGRLRYVQGSMVCVRRGRHVTICTVLSMSLGEKCNFRVRQKELQPIVAVLFVYFT